MHAPIHLPASIVPSASEPLPARHVSAQGDRGPAATDARAAWGMASSQGDLAGDAFATHLWPEAPDRPTAPVAPAAPDDWTSNEDETRDGTVGEGDGDITRSSEMASVVARHASPSVSGSAATPADRGVAPAAVSGTMPTGREAVQPHDPSSQVRAHVGASSDAASEADIHAPRPGPPDRPAPPGSPPLAMPPVKEAMPFGSVPLRPGSMIDSGRMPDRPIGQGGAIAPPARPNGAKGGLVPPPLAGAAPEARAEVADIQRTDQIRRADLAPAPRTNTTGIAVPIEADPRREPAGPTRIGAALDAQVAAGGRTAPAWLHREGGARRATEDEAPARPSPLPVAQAVAAVQVAEASPPALDVPVPASRLADALRAVVHRLAQPLAGDARAMSDGGRSASDPFASARSADGVRVSELRIAPPELGRLRITLRGGADDLRIAISADRTETLDLVRRNLDVLHRTLGADGLRADRIELDGDPARDARMDRGGRDSGTQPDGGGRTGTDGDARGAREDGTASDHAPGTGGSKANGTDAAVGARPEPPARLGSAPRLDIRL